MAVRMMTTADKAGQPNVEIVTNFFGHETNRIAHKYDCPFTGQKGYILAEEGQTEGPCGCKTYGPLYMETTYVGCVVALRERNWHDDSDFIAVVWDAETESFKDVEYASTRGWTYPNGAAVDATPEIAAKYVAHLNAAREAERKAYEEEQARKVEKGKLVRVVGGRKYKGREGEVVWVGADKYRSYYRNGYNSPSNPDCLRVGVKDVSGETFFLPYKQVEVIQPESMAK